MVQSDIDDGRRNVAAELAADATSCGALRGSARGDRNISMRIAEMDALGLLRSGSRMLDIGCGSGEYTTELAPRFEKVDGIDIERDRLDLFEQSKLEHIDLEIMSATNMSYDDNTFDVVVMIEVLEHLANVAGSLREIQRVLNPSGSLYLTTPSRRWPFEQHGVIIKGKRYPSYYLPGLVWVKPLHERFSDAAAFEPKEIKRLAEGADLKMVDYRFMMPPLDSLAEGHVAHRISEQLAEAGVSKFFGQTLVARLDQRER